MRRPYWISKKAKPTDFPPIEQALHHPDGLLAIGGDLSPARLLAGYQRGIFPWYSDDQPILWWSPSERMVLFPDMLKVSRSLRKTIRKRPYKLTLDQAFREVIIACAGPRPDQDGTWLTNDMIEAYCELHRMGIAHSVESWHENKLVGGLYGVSLGRVFFGESMFARMADASKIAFCHFVWQLEHWGYGMIDSQVYTDHLARFGAFEIPRHDFRHLLDKLSDSSTGYKGDWHFDRDILQKS